MTQQYNFIYRDHAAKSSSAPNLTEEGGEHAPAGGRSSSQTNVEMNLMYRIMFGLRSELGSCSVLICWAHFGEHFILPALWDLSHRPKYSTICFSSDAVIASLLCLHDAEVSHLLYATFTVWMSRNSRSKCSTHYDILFLLHGDKLQVCCPASDLLTLWSLTPSNCSHKILHFSVFIGPFEKKN